MSDSNNDSSRNHKDSRNFDDFEILKKQVRTRAQNLSFDEYIDFATQVNEFAGHPIRESRRITGDLFLL